MWGDLLIRPVGHCNACHSELVVLVVPSFRLLGFYICRFLYST